MCFFFVAFFLLDIFLPVEKKHQNYKYHIGLIIYKLHAILIRDLITAKQKQRDRQDGGLNRWILLVMTLRTGQQ